MRPLHISIILVASIAMIGILSSTTIAASCQTMADFASSCVGGSITQDSTNGCRTIKCVAGGSSMQALACNKPDGGSPQFFELYKQTTVGTGVTKLCLGTVCVGPNGFAKSAPYTCASTCVPSTEICDGKDNNCNGQIDENNVCAPLCAPMTEVCDGKDNNCNGQIDENNVCTACATNVFTATVTCTSAITSDISTGCRTITCGASNSITVQGCNKNGFFELYRQAASGTPPKVCFGTTCIQYEGFMKSATCSTPATTNTTNTTNSTSSGAFPLKTNIVSTIFWAGQAPSADTGWSNNYDSAWDVWWQEHYGGYDDPNNRNGYYPAAFTPKENPFYVAIPYTDFSTTGRKSDAMSVVPWSNEKTWGSQESMIKNRWVKITKGTKTAYAQVENAGPGPTDDWQYVFGSNPQPTTSFGWKAGIDVSPAVRDYLTLGAVDTVSWQWISASDVPSGPWKNIVTTRQSCWASTICP